MQKENKSKGVRKANSSSPMAEAKAAQMVEKEREKPECAHEHREIALQYAAQVPSSCQPSSLNLSRYNAHEELNSPHFLPMN